MTTTQTPVPAVPGPRSERSGRVDLSAFRPRRTLAQQVGKFGDACLALAFAPAIVAVGYIAASSAGGAVAILVAVTAALTILGTLGWAVSSALRTRGGQR